MHSNKKKNKGNDENNEKILLFTLTFCLTCYMLPIQSVNASTDLTDNYLNDIKDQVCLLSKEIEISKLNKP